MPTYEYECKKCNHRFEVFQSMSDEPIKKCPECGKQVRRLVSGGVGVIFKGSGFYVTDKNIAAVPKSDTGSKETSKADMSSPNGDSPKGDASKGDGVSKAKGKAKPAA
jgi:putative FmdB family regulatory protein